MSWLGTLKTCFAFGLSLVGNESTSNLVGKWVGILAQTDHLLERLFVHVALEQGAADLIGILICKLFDERIRGIRGGNA